ncbi:MAG: hypothetical protein JHC34_00295 [Acidobacteria bacterium]|jgi:hypothetical protein|nr:hypothetical protein [Acidobacteriota bacterium]
MATEKKNASETTKPKNPPAWEIFIVGEDGKILEREWKNDKTGATGTAWDKRGALWTGVTKDGAARLSGSLKLPTLSTPADKGLVNGALAPLH